MFGWSSIGLALAIGAFFGVYAGFGLALVMRVLCKKAQPEPPQPAECGYVDNRQAQNFTVFDDAVATHLLKQCDF